MRQQDKRKFPKSGRRDRKASHLKIIEAAKQEALKRSTFDTETLYGMVAKVIDIEHRLVAVEERAGVPGPRGERGATGAAFKWPWD